MIEAAGVHFRHEDWQVKQAFHESLSMLGLVLRPGHLDLQPQMFFVISRAAGVNSSSGETFETRDDSEMIFRENTHFYF